MVLVRLGGLLPSFQKGMDETHRRFDLGLISVEAIGEGAKRSLLVGVLGILFNKGLTTWS